MRHSDDGFRIKIHRIHIFIGNSPINGSYLFFLSIIGFKVQPISIYNQIIAADQRHTHTLCQIRMFKICCIVTPRCEHYRQTTGIHIIQCFFQKICIIPVVCYGYILKCLWAASSAQFPGNHWIRCTGRNPQIIFQDIPVSILSIYQIDSGYMGINSFGRDNPLVLSQITTGSINKLFRYYLIFQYFLLVINIFQKKIQRCNSLF